MDPSFPLQERYILQRPRKHVWSGYLYHDSQGLPLSTRISYTREQAVDVDVLSAKT